MKINGPNPLWFLGSATILLQISRWRDSVKDEVTWLVCAVLACISLCLGIFFTVRNLWINTRSSVGWKPKQ